MATSVSASPVAIYLVTGHGGGQAPPNPAGGSSSYSVLVAKGLPPATAETLRDGLIKEGFTAAKVQPGSEGRSEVILGGLTSSNQANALMDELRKSGYSPESIIEKRGASAPAAATGESVFRVKVAEFATAAEADEASKVLADDGFVNVDVVEENGRHLLMLGTFNRKQDAESLLTDVNKAGFALASVITRDRLRTADSGIASADLSGLSATEQEQTRDVLEMAQKVESGEASAAEMKQLREMIQQLSSNQKAILGREESNRSADRDKLQRIFVLYRQFDQAIKRNDLTAAEKALAEVKQIDPNDIFLANRLQVLENRRSGGVAPGQQAAAGSSTVDPAEVQQLLNEGRELEASGNSAGALQKFQAVLAMDPTNVEARGKVAELGDSSSAPASDADAGIIEKLTGNKNILYGAIGLIVLLIAGIWLKSRSGKSEPRTATPAGGVTTMSSTSDFSDSLSAGVGPDTSAAALSGGSALAGAGMAGFGQMDEEESNEPPETGSPEPPATSASVVEESDSVSLEGFDNEPSAPEATTPAAAETPSTAEDEVVSINFEDDSAPAVETPAAATPAPTDEEKAPAAAPSSAMDADLEALLQGTFPGASESAPPLQSATPGDGVEDLTAVGAVAGAAAAHTIFTQSFDNDPENTQPEGWRGEYEFASLSVVNLGEAGHTQCIMYDKPEGSGSATYHLSFPQAKGRVTAEFDIRCDEKNKFLLGVYLERDEDFKQSVHTIVHQLDPDAPASLRVQGAATPYQMGSWSHVRYEIDLEAGVVNGFVDNEQVVTDAKLATAPEYVNTLSIRDNLATTGKLYLDNISISEA